MMTSYRLLAAFLLCCGIAWAGEREPARFYLDSTAGNDAATGTSPEQAWKTIRRLDQEILVGGDTVLFRRGGLWREPLRPKSGTEGKPVVYEAYGEGDKPILQGSTSRNKPEDWKSCGDKLWETLPVQAARGVEIPVHFASNWQVYQEKPASVRLERSPKGFALHVAANGTTSTNIQLIGPTIPAEGLRNSALLKFRAKCSKPFTIPSMIVRMQGSPWYGYLQAEKAATVTENWQEFEVMMTNHRFGDKGSLVLYVGAAVPENSVFEFEPLSLHTASFPDGRQPLTVDVGNMIFDDGKLVGFKRWAIDELRENGDFWHDIGAGRVVLYMDKNPATAFKDVELCLKRNIADHGNLSDCVLRGLAMRYSAAHGVGGQGAKRVVIEDCDIYFIGGGHLYTRNNKPTRYGNGIEWWCEASDCLVQRCRLWEIYDVAFSPQGNATNKTTRNITIRNNVIWNCEQSFEYWRTGDGAVTENVVFEHNTCVDAGFGWSHRQRPDKRGTHFLSYHVTAKTDITLRNNIFCRGANDLISMFSDWRKGAKLDHNLWWQPDGEWLVFFLGKNIYKAEEFEKYLEEFGIDKDSIRAEPTFIDAAKRDYRLAPNSAGRKAASDGGAVGVRE